MSTVTDPSGLLLDVALSAAVLLLVGLAGASLTRQAWKRTPHLGLAYGLLAVGVAGISCFFAFLVSPGVGVVVSRGLCSSAAAIAAWSVWSHRLLLARHWRAVMAPALLVAGVLLCVVSLFALWQHDLSWFQLARIRFSHDLPSDNEIPSLLAVPMLEGGDPRTAPGGGWQSSDRPPLQTGLLLLVRAAAGWAGSGTTDLDLAAGLVAQALWLVAGHALLRALGLSARTSVVALVFAGASGTVLVNTVFTWPKLLSAAFVLAALAVVMDLGRTRRPTASLIAAGMLVTLALLSHGAAAFALPVLAWALYRVRRSLSLRACVGAAVVSALAYLPWLLYQRLYDPPGDRLLKWHLAGVMQPTERSFGETFVDAYTQTPLRTLLEYKLNNLTLPFSELPWAGIWTVATNPSDRRIAEFFILSPAVGLGTLALGYLIVRALGSLRRRGTGDEFLRSSVGLLLAVASSLVAWSLVLFLPGSGIVHVGSHAPVLLLLLLPFAELVRRRPAPATALLAAQVALLVLTYGPGPAATGPVSALAVGLGVAGAALTAAAVAVAVRETPGTEAFGTGAIQDDDTRPIALPHDRQRVAPAH